MDIKIRGVQKHFGNFHALRGIDLDIASGELLALLGPSGSGKTTLLRAIAGLEPLDAGRILFGDIDATQLTVQARRVGLVFQQYALFKHMTVFDNVAFGLSVRKASERPSKAAIAARVEALLALVQLDGLEGRYPAQLSGGQKQRVALARALAIEPRVLLLDEPFGALDAKVRKDLRRWLRKLHSETGYTTIFVTHDQEEALELADRVVIMNRGRIEQIGTTDDVYDHPQTPFVFDFLGTPNILTGTARGSHIVLDENDVVLERSVIQPQGAVDVYARPADFEIAAPSTSGIGGEILEIQRTGFLIRLRLRLQQTAQTIEIEITHAATQKNWAIGDNLRVRPLRFSVYPRTQETPAPQPIALETPGFGISHTVADHRVRARN